MTSLRFRDRIIVPPEWCFKCDVCCRFPEKDSFLAPYFTHDEITAASVPDFASKKGGCKITLVPCKEGFICPEFNPVSAHCEIYDVRPLDCIIYPFAIMWSAEGKEIVLGVDMKCPYVVEFINSDSLKGVVPEMRNTIDSSPVLDIISENPDFVGPYQDDVTHAVVLTNLTQALASTGRRFRRQN